MARRSTSKVRGPAAADSREGALPITKGTAEPGGDCAARFEGPPLNGVDCQAVFEEFPEAVFLVRHDMPVLAANARAVVLTGLSASELSGRRLEDLVSCRGGPLTFRRLAKLATESVDHHEGVLRRADGTTLPVALSVSDLRKSGQPLIAIAVRDISSQLAMLASLNDAIQRLKFHVERMPLAHVVWDTSFRVVDWNAAAERIFGYTRKQALGKHAYDLLVPESAKTAVERVWQGLLEGDTASHSLNLNRRRDGSTLTCEWFNTPLRSPDGGIVGVASMAMDVSKRQETEERIRDAQKLESLGILASGIAHDFNSSLMVILGNAALLRAVKDLPARCLEHLELIEDAGARANELVKHLLAYARTGRHNPQPTQLNSVIQDAAAFVRSSLGPKYELCLSLGDELPAIHADRSQLEQVVLNLCLNAAQAMPDGGVVRVETQPVRLTVAAASKCVPYGAHAGDYVEVTVRDTGCGMERETISRIFDPFYSTKSDGHGLGLAAVLGILRQHNAVAHVLSKPGRGTDFHVYFPPAQPEGVAPVL